MSRGYGMSYSLCMFMLCLSQLYFVDMSVIKGCKYVIRNSF